MLGLHAVIVGHGGRRGALNGGTIWWIAPTYPIASLIWRDLKFSLADAWTDKSETERRIELVGGGSVTVKSADNPDGLRGAGLHGVVCDEAAFMDEHAWPEVLRPALSDKQGWAIFISTPKGLNWFYELWRTAKTQPGWFAWQAPTSDNPLIPAAELSTAKSELHSLVYQQEYEAQFVTAGGQVFGEPERYDKAVLAGSRIVIACDPAATEKASADYSAIAVLAIRGKGPEQSAEVIEMVRRRVEIPALIQILIELQSRYNAPVHVEAVGGFKGIPQMLRAMQPQLKVVEINPRGDKFMRAQGVAAAWNQGRVRVPAQAPWLRDFLYEVRSFTGIRGSDAHDDQVDALAHAWNAIALAEPPRTRESRAANYLPFG